VKNGRSEGVGSGIGGEEGEEERGVGFGEEAGTRCRKEKEVRNAEADF